MAFAEWFFLFLSHLWIFSNVCLKGLWCKVSITWLTQKWMKNTSFLCNYRLLFNGQWFCLCSLSLLQETYTCSRFGVNNYRDKPFEENLQSNSYFFNYFTVLKQYYSSTFFSEARERPMESSCCINKYTELCFCPSPVAYTGFGYQPFISPAV